MNKLLEHLYAGFDDPGDVMPEDAIRSVHSFGLARSFLIKDEGGKSIGMCMLRRHPDMAHFVYDPYFSIDEKRQREGYGTASAVRILEGLNREGCAAVLVDLEDPRRIAGVYPKKNLGLVKHTCYRRLNFWCQPAIGGHIVFGDPQYCRYSSFTPDPEADPSSLTQNYDVMGVLPTNRSHPYWNHVFGTDRTQMRMDAYRECYVRIFRLSARIPARLATDVEMCRKWPGVNEFLVNRWQPAYDKGVRTVELYQPALHQPPDDHFDL